MTIEIASSLPQKDKLLALYRERKGAALSACQPLINKFSSYYSFFRTSYVGNPYQAYRLNIHVPYIFSIIESSVSRKVQALFGGWPIVDFVGASAEDAARCRKVSTLVSYQMMDDEILSKAIDFFLSAELYGTGIGKVTWKNHERYEQWRQPTYDEDGNEVGEEMKEGYVTRFDGPTFDVVDLQDFWGQPNKISIAAMKYCFHRYYLDFEDIKDLGRKGYFDKEAIADLKMLGLPPAVEADYNLRRAVYRNDIAASSAASKFDKPVMLVDMIGEVPEGFGFGKNRWLIVTVANDGVVMRFRPFPYWHGKLPFIAHSPMPDPHIFYGVGKAEPIAKVGALVNRIASQKAEAGDLAISPMWLVNRMAGINTDNLITRAGKIIGADGPVDESVIRPLSPDPTAFAIAHNEMESYWRIMQQSTGEVEDIVGSGIKASGSSHQTASEYQGRQESGLGRKNLEILLANAEVVEPLGNYFRWLDHQFLDVPHQMRILGGQGQTNELTGLPLPPEPQMINLSDIQPDYRARAIGSVQILSRAGRQQNALTLLQMVSTNPVAIKIMNWNSFFRYIFKTFDIPNIDEFLVTSIPQVNQDVSDATNGAPEQSQGGPDEGLSGPPPAAGPQLPPMAMQALIASLQEGNTPPQ